MIPFSASVQTSRNHQEEQDYSTPTKHAPDKSDNDVPNFNHNLPFIPSDVNLRTLM